MTSNSDPAELGAIELLRHYAGKTLSPVEVIAAVLDRVRRLDPHVNAFCWIDEDAALAAAKASETRWSQGRPAGPIDGVPCTIKDLVLTRGMPTRKGSRTVTATGPWHVDAPVTARLREAGGIIIGKTTTCEFGWKGVADSPLTGITRNPWNTAMTPGGSSGGAAVAAALNMGVLHIGSDAAGSIRIPCAFTGVFGIKPSFGYVPQWPASAMGTLSHLGPMTRTVNDAALMLSVIGRSDTRDFYCNDSAHRDWFQGLDTGVKGLRVAYSPTLGYTRVDPDVLERTDECAKLLAELGATVELVDPGFADPTECLQTLWYAGAANAVGKLDDSAMEALDPGLRRIAEQGRRIDILQYLGAIDKRIELAEHMAAFHEQWDLLLTPTMPLTAFPVGRNVPDGWWSTDWVTWSPFCHPFNLTQQPAASVPFGYAGNNLPVGVQLVAARYRDDLVLRTAQAISQACPALFPTEARFFPRSL